jgi:molybdopterin-guanine dinucleotide biosynthesis protein A
MTSQTHVLILAGQRAGVVDPLCEQAGIERKALLPIHARPMIQYVLDALGASALTHKPFWISGLDKGLIDPALHQSPSAAGPASSVVVAAEADLPYPFLVTTCDHPLLTTQMVDTFLQNSEKSGADFTLGLADKTVIQPAYPHVKRTYLNFKNKSVSGCNLFYVRNEQGLGAIRFWQGAQNDRKKPIKLARRMGFGLLLKYITGRLTLEGAFEQASAKLSLKAVPILLPFAEAAIDVDKPSDLDLVTSILAGQK